MDKSRNKVEIAFKVDKSKYDDSNAFIINGEGKKTSKKNNPKFNKKNIKPQLLSRKKRKKLEKILERKNKKFNRAKLIEDLKQYQAKEVEYDLMPSTSVIQTAGRKRINSVLQLYKSINKDDENHVVTKSLFKHFKVPKIKFKSNEKNFNRKNPSVVGLNDSESSSDESEENLSESSSEKNEFNLENTEDLEVQEENSDSLPKIDQNGQISLNSNDITNITKNPSENKVVAKNESVKNEPKNTKSRFILVERLTEIQEARLKLPILAEEHTIMDAIMYNTVVIICGETGSGKTTQIPQFLYEAGYTMGGKIIGVTEPRRIAAISMSKRVAHELNLKSFEVSYQIRFEGNVTDSTKIKFMTDGILLKEIEQDFLLKKYSSIIIDEAHERSLYSDILIGFLSRVVQIREKKGDPLKLIIMSATLRVEDFTDNHRLFKVPPPVIKVDSRQYQVNVHFSKRTNSNYVQEAFRKICKTHSTLPPGGILVFVTGRKEVLMLCQMLSQKFPLKQKFKDDDNDTEDTEKKEEPIDKDENLDKKIDDSLLLKSKVNLDLYSIDPIEEERVIDDLDYSDNESDAQSDDESFNLDFETTDEPLYCLPLYSMLPAHKQALVFKNPPSGCRLCVIATNVAETSLTIPNIKYVIDTGKVKKKIYDNVTGVSTFIIDWTSKASADQRAGRAGRTSSGHCYRLFSSAVFNNDFKQFNDPDVLVKPVDDLLLQMKAIGIDNVINFPFPTQPNVESLVAAERRLILLDALKEETFLNSKNKKITHSKITHIGRLMSNFPVNPRFSKMLCLSKQCDLMPYSLAIISALTVQELFLNNEENSSAQKHRKSLLFSNKNCYTLGDLMALLSAIGSANYEGLSSKFCEHYGLRHNAMIEVNKLRSQLINQVKQINKNFSLSMELAVPNDYQIKMMRQLFLCGFSDHVAKRIPCDYSREEDGSVRKKLVRNCYQSIEVDSRVFISSDSVLFNENPEYVVYHDLFESSKLFMRNIVVIEPEWLPIYAAKHCTFSNPLEDPPPEYDSKLDQVMCYRTSTFGPHHWEMPVVKVEYPDGLEKYRYFSYFLFNGDVFIWFAKKIKFMSTPPLIFTKNWSFAQPKVNKVIKLLTDNEIFSKRSLLRKWQSNNKFLLEEYLEWIHESHQNSIRSSWPPKS